MKNVLALVGVCLVFFVPGGAKAGSEAGVHDGFHFQVGTGLGYYKVSSDINQDFSGLTIPLQLLFGGTVGPLAIGGSLIWDYAPSPSTDTPGVSSQSVIGLGAYADYHLNKRGNGLHIQAFLGFGGLETSFNGNVGGSDPTGIVTYVGVGHQWFFSDQWGYGVMGRLVYAPLDLNGTSFSTVEPAVLGTLTWH